LRRPGWRREAYRYVEAAVKLALDGKIAVIVTAPLNKAAMHAAGHHFDGHTELLAHLTGAKSSFMLLARDKLNAIHVTTHTSLRNAAEKPTMERVSRPSALTSAFQNSVSPIRASRRLG
jgi:4-hydroxythreonine-4-phosphate dehydrogenase